MSLQERFSQFRHTFSSLNSVRQLQSDDAYYERCDEKQSPECCRFLEEDDAHHNRSNGSYARPYRVSRAYRNGVHGFGQQHHAQRKADDEARAPGLVFRSGCLFHLAQAKGEARLEHSGDYQYNPVHESLLFAMSCLSACKGTENCQNFNLVRLKKMPHVSVRLTKNHLMPFRRVPIANRLAVIHLPATRPMPLFRHSVSAENCSPKRLVNTTFTLPERPSGRQRNKWGVSPAAGLLPSCDA